jgi:outer membrane protein, heavy metal efflux system
MKTFSRILFASSLLAIACSVAPKGQEPKDFYDSSNRKQTKPQAEIATITSVKVLSLEVALELCNSNHPRLREMKTRIRGAEGQILQAGLLPNPSLIAGVEQIPLRGSARKFVQPIVGISQDIPIGGRLSRAEELAKKEQVEAQRALDLARRELHRRVRGKFATALYMERVAELQRSTKALADELVRIVTVRVQGGDDSPDEMARAELETYRVEVETANVEALRRRAFIELTMAMGLPRLKIESLAGRLEEKLEIGRAQRLLKELDETAELRLADAAIESQKATIALIEAESVPDISLDLFYRRLEDDNIDSVDLGVSIPLGIFDRRQGDLLTANAKLNEHLFRRRRIRSELESRLRKTRVALKSALARTVTLREKVLPRAKTVLIAAKARFEAGDIGLSELLFRQRDDVSLQIAYLESLRDVMVAWVEISSFGTKG